MQWGRALRKISSSKIDSARGGAGNFCGEAGFGC